MGNELTLDVNRPYPTDDNAMASAGGASGTFTGATYSFMLVAWYSSGETNNDNAGWDIATPANWENLVVADYAIAAVDTVAETFTVVGDQTLSFVTGHLFEVTGSTGNDGTWTVDTSAFGGVNTVITVTGDITDATADGDCNPNHVTIDWDTPLDANGEKRYPNHYTVYAQVGATYTLGSAGTKCWTNTTGTATTFASTATSGTLYNEGTVNKTMGAAYTQVVLNPILDMNGTLRQQTVRAFDGRLVKKSYAHPNPVDYLDLLLVTNSCSNANFKKILGWILFSTPIKITESTTASAENDPFVEFWYGRFTDSPRYLGSKGKNSAQVIPLQFRVETATLA